MPNARALLLALCALAPACVETRSTRLGGAPLEAREVRVLARWEVLQGPERVGVLERLWIADPAEPVEVYRVRRPGGQVVGQIDLAGRAFRYAPFEDDLVFLGMGRMEEHLTTLLQLDGDVATRPFDDAAAVEAGFERTRPRPGEAADGEVRR
ncbi:MAG: hypothetical protein R3F30_03850 [Planctomycetota bacterium]